MANKDSGNLHAIDLPAEIKEGWGITNTDKELIISDGSSTLYFIQANSSNLTDFKVVRSIEVKENNKTYSYLNELEYSNGYIFANVFLSNEILIIDPKDGDIKKIIDFSLLTRFEKSINNGADIDVLNGIAFDKKHDRFYITGKHWSHIYYVKLKSDIKNIK